MFIQLMLSVAVVGLVCCTGFLVLVVVSAVRFRRRQQSDGNFVSNSPAVSLLKPLCGLEPNLEANLASFFNQDYANFEVVFGTRNAQDPALKVVRAVQKHYPHIPVKVVFSGEPDRPNAKVCSLEKMYAAASHDYLVISDSDVQVQPNYVREVVRPLQDPKVGLVTCLYRGVPTGGIWSRLEALGMSVEMTSGVLVADLLEGMKFALGPTMAIRRDVLEKIGGFGILADYCADDYVLGHEVFEAGYTVVLSKHIIDHVVLNRSLKASVTHQIRWMKSTRFSRQMGHVGTVLTFAMPFGILGAMTALFEHRPLLGAALFGWAVLNRIIMSAAVGWGVVRDPRSLKYGCLYPMRDFMGFCFWCASFIGRSIVWRGESYRLEFGGKMVRTGVVETEELASGTVAVDHLA